MSGMLAGNVDTPAELVAEYGDVQTHWAFGASLTAGKARTAPAGHDVIRHGWSCYLELARIREMTAGESFGDPWEILDGDYRDAFTQAYAYAMLWANTTAERNGEPAGESVTPEDWQTPGPLWALEAFDSDSRDSIRADCDDFMDSNAWDLRGLDASQSGHDFALTRNGRGAGFWDRGLGELGERLTAMSKPYGESCAWFDADDDSAEVHLMS